MALLQQDVDMLGFTQSERLEYDKHVEFYHSNLVNALLLYTYGESQLDDMHDLLGNPLHELWEELDYAFTPGLLETIFRNNVLQHEIKSELIEFKIKVKAIPDELWEWDQLDKNPIWQSIRSEADRLLNIMNVNSRTYDTSYTTIYNGSTGRVIVKGSNQEKDKHPLTKPTRPRRLIARRDA